MKVDLRPLLWHRNLIITILIWFCLWFIPWGELFQDVSNLYLGFVLDLVCLGLALLIFLVPGILLYWLFEPKRNNLVDDIGLLPIGFALSTTLICMIGIIGRIAGFSFQTVKILFAFTGGLEFILLSVFTTRLQSIKWDFRHTFAWIKLYGPLLFVIFLSALLTFHDELFFIDDRTYLAYITNWQHSSSLNFNNIVIKSDVLELERFWLALYPMGQALLADLSGIPAILLIANYLELYLVPVAVVASYWFGRELGLSRKASVLSALIQIALFSWMIGEEWPVGKWFFESMGEDKVSAVFHLTPVFFVFLLRYLDRPITKNFILFLVCGIALTLTHPVSLFFACAITGGFVLCSWTTRPFRARTFAVVSLICVMLTMPYIVIRIVDYSSQAAFTLETSSLSNSYQADRYVNIISDVFYGFNPGVLLFFDIPSNSRFYQQYQIVRSFPLVILVVAGTLAILRLKQGPFYWYISICVFLILFAMIPYTGWILGYFTDARLIYRVTWYMPLGMSVVLILMSLDKWLNNRSCFFIFQNTVSYRILKDYFFWFLISSAFVSPLVVFRTIPHVSRYFDFLDHNIQLAEVGSYIDSNSRDPVISIGLDYMDTQFLPGVSAHTRLISFREEKLENGHNYFLRPEEVLERKRASNVIRMIDLNTSVEERCLLMEKYVIEYVVVPREELETYKQVLQPCEFQITDVFFTRDLILLNIRYSISSS